jgi:predicted tellurium resistance membrane protein TerC
MELLTRPETWLAFVTLTVLELVLGIDNVIFIAILVDKLPEARREATRRAGLLIAMVMRVALLFAIAWIVGATAPLFTVFGNEISARDLIMIGGGVFLIWKSTKEIDQLLEGESGHESKAVKNTYQAVLVQIVVVDIVFSFDSIITAVGMARQVSVMIAAVVASVGLMMAFAGGIGRFVSAHPTVKMLALSFLMLIGVLLIADGFDHHVPKGYVYFAMAFSVAVEMLNLRMRKRAVKPVTLHEPYAPSESSPGPPRG